ncbi:uncharacterized protein PRCAT00003169001 [Priceomyces carsonii]|uniref:uncharacterized protein n=1 Tax=Priceomyces carsonii TaxID=28549 RepID=UPI002ED944F6|nr:unnamed protein product [Priceomyces carsonii]
MTNSLLDGLLNVPNNPKQSPRPKLLLGSQNDESKNSTSSLPSPLTKASSKMKKHGSKPHIKRLASGGKYVFSVDDAISDVESGEEAELKRKEQYLEGYNDALKALTQKKSKSSSILPAIYSEAIEDGKDNNKLDSGQDLLNKTTSIETNISNNLRVTEEALGSLDAIESNPTIPEQDEEYEDYRNKDNNDSGSVRSSLSSETIESLNLRERQDAINSTHPFGIKIWKPSLYKKKRSVASKADADIHDFYSRRPTGIFWTTSFFNAIWTLTVGVILCTFCTLGAIFVFLCSGFAINKYLRAYVKLLLKLGYYWLYPFGRFILLNKDSNYLEEDQLDGRSISEFHKWRSQDEGRLFFAPPRRYTNADESRPLLKDHKGRPLREAYPSLDEFCTDDADFSSTKFRLFGRGSWSSGRFIFYIYFYGILQPVIYIVGLICWLIVFTIPMAKISSILCDHLRRHPLAIDFESEKEYYKGNRRRKHQLILLCTYRCVGLHYYKYTIDGTNIFFINLLTAVFFVILDYYLLKEKLEWSTWFTDASFLFCACLFSIIPLAYFIGQAVASISAQSSMGVGAVINAFFSTVVEIFLYCVALNQGKGKLVEGSMIGSILGGVLLLPGLSMVGGAYRRKTQRYNPRSAGVSSTMLLFAMVIMFAPSLFYQIYGSYEMKCKSCDFTVDNDDCTQCRFTQPKFTLDELYYKIIKPFSIIVAIALFLAYICGLFFTLRTHASLIWATASHEGVKKEEQLRSPSIISLDNQQLQREGNSLLTSVQPDIRASSSKLGQTTPGNDTPKIHSTKDRAPITRRSSTMDNEDQGGGHDAPNWSRNKSIVILLGATLLYAIIAEILVDNVDSVLSIFPIDPKFLGLTVFALVPNTTEFVNAISFAIGGNVALSMEIGSAYALQVVLIQIPSLVVYTIFKGYTKVDNMFALVFPRWDIIAALISIYLFTYIYAEGKSNYFKGAILILIYIVVLVGFWLNHKIEFLDDGYGSGPLFFSNLV